MTNEPNITERFFISGLSMVIRTFLTPYYYAMRTDMGVQFTGFLPVLRPLVFYVSVGHFFSTTSETDGNVLTLVSILAFVGYLRNVFQARRRRRKHDWTVHSWSTGISLVEPLLVFAHHGLRRNWGHLPGVRWLVPRLLKNDFIYYFAEPFTLCVIAAALHSIGTRLWFSPIVYALGLIIVRSDSQLDTYLMAHAVVDGQMTEQSIRQQLEGPNLGIGGAGIATAQLPVAPVHLEPTDDQSVFDRLSPELQILLASGRANRN